MGSSIIWRSRGQRPSAHRQCPWPCARGLAARRGALPQKLAWLVALHPCRRPSRRPTWCVRPVSGRQLTRLSPPACRAAASAASERGAGLPWLARSAPATDSTTLNSVSAGLPSGSTRRATLRSGRYGGAHAQGRAGHAVLAGVFTPLARLWQRRPTFPSTARPLGITAANSIQSQQQQQLQQAYAKSGRLNVSAWLVRAWRGQPAAHTSSGSRSMGASTVKWPCCGTPTASARYCLRTVLRLQGGSAAWQWAGQRVMKGDGTGGGGWGAHAAQRDGGRKRAAGIGRQGAPWVVPAGAAGRQGCPARASLCGIAAHTHGNRGIQAGRPQAGPCTASGRAHGRSTHAPAGLGTPTRAPGPQAGTTPPCTPYAPELGVHPVHNILLLGKQHHPRGVHVQPVQRQRLKPQGACAGRAGRERP